MKAPRITYTMATVATAARTTHGVRLGVESCILEGRRDGVDVHPFHPAPGDAAADAGSRGAATRGASGRRAVRPSVVVIGLVYE